MAERWTPDETAYLAEHAYMGSAGAADALNAHFGTSRTAAAVKSHAARQGVSLMCYAFCADCRRAVPTVNRDGRCPACAARARVERNRERRARIESNVVAITREEETMNRTYERERKRMQRLQEL